MARITSSLPLQGEKDFSHSSSELSSLGGVWLVRNGEKIKENEGKRKEAGELKASCQKEILLMKKMSRYSVCLGLYTAPKQYKLPKSTKAVNCYKDKMERNQKRNKNVKKSNGQHR